MQKITLQENAKITLKDKIENVFSKEIGKLFTRREIVALVIEQYPDTNSTSIIPSDYCYNMINKGIIFQNHLFEQLDTGNYKVLGKNYAYEGPIFWKGEKVGEWKKGEKEPQFFKNVHGFGDSSKGVDMFIKQHDVNIQQIINDNLDMKSKIPLNQILYGPPGTGKTFNTINKALEILDPDFLNKNLEKRDALKNRFDDFVEDERIVFCTFHQSFSYEDFVEGLRAVSVNSQIEYRVESGVFKTICGLAKSSTSNEDLIAESFDSDAAIDAALQQFIEQITDNPIKLETFRGKLFSVSYKPGRIGIHCLPDASANGKFMKPSIEVIRQLLMGIEPTSRAYKSYAKSIADYIRNSFGKNEPKLSTNSNVNAENDNKIPYVLIIDEINRGNISKIFGELITLIEPSKRASNSEELSVTLPYSKQSFTVPDNVYLIGTMNTADRSLASLDIALRRRFDFIEMPPQPNLLKDVSIKHNDITVNIAELLHVMNNRIEVLLGRDYCLGHAYFMDLQKNATMDALADIFRLRIIPLLQEYFFEDWLRISWVLNDHRKNKDNCFLSQSQSSNALDLFGDEVGSQLQDNRWQINDKVFDRIETYKEIINAKANV